MKIRDDELPLFSFIPIQPKREAQKRRDRRFVVVKSTQSSEAAKNVNFTAYYSLLQPKPGDVVT